MWRLLSMREYADMCLTHINSVFPGTSRMPELIKGKVDSAGNFCNTITGEIIVPKDMLADM